MSEQNQQGYYRRREQAARELAAKAADPVIGQIHLDMAARYAELAAPMSSPSSRKGD